MITTDREVTITQARGIADQGGDTEQYIEWSGSPCPADPDNFWIDDETGERVNAATGERTKCDA